MGVITLQQAARWCGGRIDEKYKDISFFGASNDTRKIQEGQLFVALQGARDGHDFIPVAMEKGAAAVLCTHCDGDYPAIVVEDTRIALGDIARHERQRLGVKVIGITGSVGKSTTKEMTAKILSTTYRVSKTPVNHNNDIGMPMAILAIREDTEVAVLEMGMNHSREIAYLSGIAKPDIGVIVNVGTMHIEHLGSREGILKAKLEILEGMDENSKLVLNGDCSLLWNLRDTLKNVSYFGLRDSKCHLFGSTIREEESTFFDVGYHAQHFGIQPAPDLRPEFAVELKMRGEHNVSDALAAITVAMHMGVSRENIREALAAFQNMEGRQEMLDTGVYTIIKDCYNAGPESMAASLGVLGARKERRIAVLGDMLELGSCAAAEHYKVGRLAAENADMLFAFGPNSGKMQKGAITGGMPHNRVFAYDDRNRLVNALKQHARPGDVLLFKGSHGMHMELALELFLKEES